MSDIIVKRGSTPRPKPRAPSPDVSLASASEARGTPPHLELRIWLRLLSCTTRIEKMLSARLRKEFDTTLARFDLLAQLARAPEGSTMSEISRRLMVSNGAITALVGRLESDGHLRREIVPADRRTIMLRLTPQGAAHFAKMARRHEEWVVSLIGEISPIAQSDLLQHLTLLKSRLTKHV